MYIKKGEKKLKWYMRREPYSVRLKQNFLKNIAKEKNRNQIGEKDPPQQYQQQISNGQSR